MRCGRYNVESNTRRPELGARLIRPSVRRSVDPSVGAAAMQPQHGIIIINNIRLTEGGRDAWGGETPTPFPWRGLFGHISSDDHASSLPANRM